MRMFSTYVHIYEWSSYFKTGTMEQRQQEEVNSEKLGCTVGLYYVTVQATQHGSAAVAAGQSHTVFCHFLADSLVRRTLLSSRIFS